MQRWCRCVETDISWNNLLSGDRVEAGWIGYLVDVAARSKRLKQNGGMCHDEVADSRLRHCVIPSTDSAPDTM